MEKFCKTYEIRSYECNSNKQLRLVTLFNLLQDIADIHAQLIGVGYDFCIQKGLAWFGVNYHVQINRMPTWGENIRIYTWPSAKTFVSGIRDFEVLDEKNNVIVSASSQWALIDLSRGRPVAVNKFIDYDLVEERAFKTDFPTIPIPQRVDFEKNFHVRYDDIDVNRHVNNSIYPLWGAESVPDLFFQTNQIVQIAVSFKKPAVLGMPILVNTQLDDCQTIHQILDSSNQTELARLQIIWKSL